MSDLTPQQQEAVDAYLKYGSQQAAADALGISRAGIRDRLKFAAKKGVAPGHFEHGTAPGFAMGKVTVQRGPSGVVERTWERQSPEAENAQAAQPRRSRKSCPAHCLLSRQSGQWSIYSISTR
jgi:hypothetical protein